MVLLIAAGTVSFATDKGFCPPAPPVPNVSRKPKPAEPANTVTLQTVISDKGYVCSVQLVRGLDKVTNENAIAAVRQWHFDPAKRNGQAVPVIVSIDVRFAIGPDGKVLHMVDVPMATRIPAADPVKYENVIDAKEWKNPFLVIHEDGIEIVGRTPAGQFLSVESLRKALEALPESAWPYGLIVAVAETGVGPVANGVDAQITATRKKVEALLNEIGIKFTLWASA